MLRCPSARGRTRPLAPNARVSSRSHCPLSLLLKQEIRSGIVLMGSQPNGTPTTPGSPVINLNVIEGNWPTSRLVFSGLPMPTMTAARKCFQSTTWAVYNSTRSSQPDQLFTGPVLSASSESHINTSSWHMIVASTARLLGSTLRLRIWLPTSPQSDGACNASSMRHEHALLPSFPVSLSSWKFDPRPQPVLMPGAFKVKPQVAPR